MIIALVARVAFIANANDTLGTNKDIDLGTQSFIEYGLKPDRGIEMF